MDDRDGWIWVDSGLVPWRLARLHVLSHGRHDASSVFEAERAVALDKLPRFAAMFRAGTAAEVVSVRSVDALRFRVGPVGTALADGHATQVRGTARAAAA